MSSRSPEKLVYIGASLGAVVLALAVVLLIFFRHRNKDANTSSGMKQTGSLGEYLQNIMAMSCTHVRKTSRITTTPRDPSNDLGTPRPGRYDNHLMMLQPLSQTAIATNEQPHRNILATTTNKHTGMYYKNNIQGHDFNYFTCC